jgi:hypothetical protein
MVQVNDASQLMVCFIPATSLATVNSPSMVKQCVSYLELFGFIFFKAEYLGFVWFWLSFRLVGELSVQTLFYSDFNRKT